MFNFVSTLSDFVQVGHVFVVSGYTSSNFEAFKISFSCGLTPSANSALTIAPNFSNRKIHRSALIDGNCLCEENSNCENDLTPGEIFTFCILVGDDRFHLALNDKPFCTFGFQMPCNQIRSVMISGDIESLVKVNHLRTFPYLFPSIKSDCEDLAFEGFVAREFSAGDVMVVQGIVSGKADGDFTMIFVEDESLRQLIHFNVRFDEQSVIMNTMDVEEGWTDNETRSAHFPFVIDTPFKVAFAFTENAVKCAVNGIYLMEFSIHLIDLGTSQSLWDIMTGIRVKNGIDMDVKIQSVNTIQSGDKNANNFETFSQF